MQTAASACALPSSPPKLPKLQVGDYEYGNTGVTLEEAVKTIAESDWLSHM